MATHGQQLISVLDKAWRRGIAVQSDFFRRNPTYVALAASEGLISVLLPDSRFGSVWRITPLGCSTLFETQQQYEGEDNDFIVPTSNKNYGLDEPAFDPLYPCPARGNWCLSELSKADDHHHTGSFNSSSQSSGIN